MVGWLLGLRPLEGFKWTARDAAWGAVAALPMLGMFWLALRWPVGSLAEIKKYCVEELIPVFRDCDWHDLRADRAGGGDRRGDALPGHHPGRAEPMARPLAGAGGRQPAVRPAPPDHPDLCRDRDPAGGLPGAVWIATGNLLTVIIAHAIYDFVALVILRLEPSDRCAGRIDGSELGREGDFGASGGYAHGVEAASTRRGGRSTAEGGDDLPWPRASERDT